MGDGYYRNVSSTGTAQTTYTEDVDGDGASNDDCIAFWKYSFTEPMNTSGIYYQKHTATNPIFYGGITSFYNATGKSIYEGMLNANHDLRDDCNYMDIQTSSVKHKNYGFWFFKKEDFLNGGHTNPVTFDANSLISINGFRYWSGLDGGRWVVRDGNQFYISQATFGVAPEVVFRQTVSLSPNSTLWAPYTPTGDYDIRFKNPSTAIFTAHTFTDVTAVGFYIYRDNLATGNTQLKWNAFELRANVTRPETPSYNITNMSQIPVSGGIYMSDNEIDYALWRKVYNWAVSNQYCLVLDATGYVFDRDGDMGSMDVGNVVHTATEPATDMSWYDAVLWCNALSEMEGFTPCYYFDQAKTKVLRTIKNRTDSTRYTDKFPIYVDYTRNGYRLPTLDEWNSASSGSSAGWISGETTKPVGTSSPNSAGLFDMIGNVWEYCWDTNQAGEYFDPTSQLSHTVIGGAFSGNVSNPTTPVKKWGDIPSKGNPNIGFRIVRSENGTTPASSQSTGAMAIWTILDGQKITPTAAPTKIVNLVNADVVKISGNKTYKTVGDPLYESDNTGFTRTDDALVTISPFYMSKFETSYDKWREIYNWGEMNGYNFDDDGAMGCQNYRLGELTHNINEPVTETNWNDIMLWCNALSEYEGKEPVYFADAPKTIVMKKGLQWRIAMEQRLMDEGQLGVNGYPAYTNNATFARYEKNGYRLPTYAEWEVAYRSGNGAKSLGIPSSIGTSWLVNNSNDQTHDIFTSGDQPNSLGIYHLSGNVSEYVMGRRLLDYYHYHNPKDDPDEYMFGIEFRGSNFGAPARNAAEGAIGQYSCRASAPRPFLGFRVVRCDADEHKDSEPPIDIKIDVNPANYNDNTGKTFHNNNKRTGEFIKTGVSTTSVRTKWTFVTGGKVQSAPVVVDGILYVGSDDKYVYAINATTGVEVWKCLTGGAIETSSPTIYGNKLFIGSKDAFLYCIDINTGLLLWKKKGYSTAYVKSSPTVLFNTVIATFHGEFNATSTIGYDINTGTEVWRYHGSRANEGAVSADQTKVFMSTSDNLYAAADIATEIKQWEGVGVHNAASMPIVDENSVLYSCEHQLKSLNIQTGIANWTKTLNYNSDAKPWSTPAIGMVDLNGSSQKLIFWTTLYSPIARNSATKKSYVTAYKVDGTQIWQRNDFTAGFRSSPALAANVVYVGNDDSYMYAFDAATGNTIWSFKTGAAISSSPWVENGAIYFGSDDGTIYAIEADTTSLLNNTFSNQFSIYPSPATENLTVNCIEEVSNVRITNLHGQSFNLDFDARLSKINVSNLPSGIYSIQVFSKTKDLGKRFFVKK